MGIFVWLVGSHDRASRKKQWILRDKKLSIFKKHFKIYFYPMIAYPGPSLNVKRGKVSVSFLAIGLLNLIEYMSMGLKHLTVLILYHSFKVFSIQLLL